MARTYDRIIRYYDSWFADLMDEEKQFSAEEICAVLLAVRECQRVNNLVPLDALPASVRRGLSMATMREQILRINERVERMRERTRGKAHEEAAARTTSDPNKLKTLKFRKEWKQKICALYNLTIEELHEKIESDKMFRVKLYKEHNDAKCLTPQAFADYYFNEL